MTLLRTDYPEFDDRISELHAIRKNAKLFRCDSLLSYQLLFTRMRDFRKEVEQYDREFTRELETIDSLAAYYFCLSGGYHV